MSALIKVRLRHVYPPVTSSDWFQDVELVQVPRQGDKVLVTDEPLPNGNVRGHLEPVIAVVWVPGALDAYACVVLEEKRVRTVET